AGEIRAPDLLGQRLPVEKRRGLEKTCALVAVRDVFDDERVRARESLAHRRRQLSEPRVCDMHRSVDVARRDALLRYSPENALLELLAGLQACAAAKRGRREQQPRRQARGKTHRNTS